MLLAAMVAIAALMLAAAPALAQQGPPDKVTICHTPPPNDFTLEVPPQAVPGHLGHGDYLGECRGPDVNPDGNGNGDGNGDGFFDFDEPFISQDFDQEAESGDIDQSFDVSQTGDNSNQTVGIQGVANTGNAQNQIGAVDTGGFANFDDNDFFNNEDDFCEDFDGNEFCEDLEEFCEDFDGDGFCDFFFGDDNRFFDDDERFFFNGDNDGDIEFEDVGSTIEVSPTNTVDSSQQVNQAAAASAPQYVWTSHGWMLV